MKPYALSCLWVTLVACGKTEAPVLDTSSGATGGSDAQATTTREPADASVGATVASEPSHDASAAAADGSRSGLGDELLASETQKAAGCPSKTFVDYALLGAGGPGPGFGEVKKASAAAWGDGNLSVFFANADSVQFRDLGNLSPDQMVVSLDLWGGDDHLVTSGDYPLKPPQAPDSMAYAYAPVIYVTGDRTGTWTDATDFKVEIIARTNDKVCGRFKAANAQHKVSGEFTLELATELPK